MVSTADFDFARFGSNPNVPANLGYNIMFTLVITVISGGFFSDPRTVTYIPNFKTEALCIQAGEKVKEQNKGVFSGTSTKYSCVKSS